MTTHSTRTRVAALAVITGIGLATSSCSTGTEAADPAPTETTPSSTATSPSTEPPNTSPNTSPTDEPTQGPGNWQEEYSTQQLNGYDEALARWSSYETQSEPIYAAGKATPAAAKLFERYFPDPLWRNYYKQLETYEQVDVKTTGIPSVYWSRADQISTTGSSVTLVQCVDYTGVETTQRGEPAQGVPKVQKPRTREIVMDHPDGFPWLILSIENIGKKARPCTP